MIFNNPIDDFAAGALTSLGILLSLLVSIITIMRLV